MYSPSTLRVVPKFSKHFLDYNSVSGDQLNTVMICISSNNQATWILETEIDIYEGLPPMTYMDDFPKELRMISAHVESISDFPIHKCSFVEGYIQMLRSMYDRAMSNE